MGTFGLGRTFAAVALVAACGARDHAPASAVAPISPSRHAQIVRALTTPQRLALVARFQERNSPYWRVNDAALATSGTVVDPFAGFLRRARSWELRPAAVAAATEGDALAAAHAFVRKNADLLGIPSHTVLALTRAARKAVREDHASTRTTWAVRFEGTFPNKGYEAFVEIQNKVDLEVFVDDDGVPSMLSNVSEIHPRLTIDPKPSFGSDDDRVYAKLLGRRLFGLADDGTQVQLGHVERADFQRAQLVIHVSPGPMMAWLTYRLAWGVAAAKPSPDWPTLFCFFVWIVDADTGDVVVDASPPAVSAAMPGGPGP